MSKKLKVSANYLEYVPRIPDGLQMEVAEDGKVTIFIENKGFFNGIAQKFFHQPKVSQAHLDEMGSFVMRQVDGVHTINDIAEAQKETFGAKAEPVYNRLVTYMATLKDCGFIYFEEEQKKKEKKTSPKKKTGKEKTSKEDLKKSAQEKKQEKAKKKLEKQKKKEKQKNLWK